MYKHCTIYLYQNQQNINIIVDISLTFWSMKNIILTLDLTFHLPNASDQWFKWCDVSDEIQFLLIIYLLPNLFLRLFYIGGGENKNHHDTHDNIAKF